MADLAPLALPADDWHTWLEERGRGQLRVAAERVDALRAGPRGDVTLLGTWDEASLALANARAACSLLASVHPDPAVMELAETIETEASAFDTDLHLDAEVHAALASVPVDGLDADARRVLDETLRDFRRAGVDRPAEDRERLRGLDQRLTDLALTFSRNIRDGRRVTRVPAAALAGLPDDFVAAHPADADGTVAISTDYPDTHPFLTFAHDDAARRAVATSFLSLAWPENDVVLAELLRLRHEKATLLGYASWPDLDAEITMIRTGDAIGDFVDRITAAAGPAAERELAVLQERAAADLAGGAVPVDVSSWRYWFEAVRREQYGVDAQTVRRYFDFPRVRDGLLTVTGRLFGLTWTPVPGDEARTWHEDVTTYDVALDGEVLGRIHLDLHPRERKYNHAAQFDLVPGVLDRQLPEGVLVCNFPRGLMDHDDVVTLFHEFGHLLHHVLAGRQRWVRFSGVATERDFVEAPSQMLEEWAWDAAVLRTFAVDADGAPIPADLVAAMRRADEFGKALLARTQMFYAAVSLRLHLERPEDLTARVLELQREHSLLAPLPGTHFHTGFGHLEGYTSAYYTYMWSLVIAKDMFTAFDADDLFAAGPAQRYRDRVLAPGGSRDAVDLVEDLLGRPYDDRAFTRWLAG
ncbi:M3 family metallopeptidase [Cellulomonas marina]|nr:M3 family metallopeptidase [Cellulomonas marina]